MSGPVIQIRGACEPPLQDVDLDLPTGQLICLAGADGSGARELALGVLYRESRRRYAQVLSAYERETLGGGKPAAAAQVVGLPPALYLDGTLPQRQCVGELLQLEGHLGRLWQERGQTRCPSCGGSCCATTPETAAAQVVAHLGGEPCLALAPLDLRPALVEELRRAGFLRVRVAGQVLRLDRDGVPDGPGEVVLDRVEVDSAHQHRLAEACRHARTISRGISFFVGTQSQRGLWLNQELSCVDCGRHCPLGTAGLFTPTGPSAAMCYGGWEWRKLASATLGQLREFLATNDGGGALLGPLAEAEALGLGHLPLGRPVEQLSTGETRALQLSWCLGLGLAGILYVFDSPLCGLDQRAQQAVVAGLQRLVAQGNTVVLLEHQQAALDAAVQCYWFDGGRVGQTGTLTKVPPSARPRSASPPRWLRVQQPAGEWRMPLGGLVGVIGPTGGGKSTLWRQVLLPGLEARRPGPVVVEGRPSLKRTVVVGERPGESDRMLLDHLGIFPAVAAQYAESSAARDQGYAKEWFMLARPGGRCPICEGSGALICDLEFCDDLSLVCPACEGRRYRPEALFATWRGLNLAQVLELSIAAAAHHFRGLGRAGEALQAALGCGLGHRRLGEPARALGPAEALRLQLALELRRVGPGDLLVLEHPEAAAHPTDLHLLVEILSCLADRGGTVLVETHHPFVIAAADWLVEVHVGDPVRSRPPPAA